MNEILTPCILQIIIICCTAIIICVVVASVIKICVVEKRKKTLNIKDPKGSSLSGTYIFLSSVVVSIAVIIFSYSFYMEELVLDFMSLASALISIILAVITIIYSFVVNGQTTGQIDKLISASESLQETADKVENITDSYKQTADDLQGNVRILQRNLKLILERLDTAITYMQGKEGDYEVTKSSLLRDTELNPIIDKFNNSNSNAGVIIIYICSKVQETNMPCNLSKLFSEDIMYYLGYIFALNAIGFTVAAVDFSTKTIKSAKVAEKVLDGVKARFKLEAENEFMIEQKQKIDSYFSICTTE